MDISQLGIGTKAKIRCVGQGSWQKHGTKRCTTFKCKLSKKVIKYAISRSEITS